MKSFQHLLLPALLCVACEKGEPIVEGRDGGASALWPEPAITLESAPGENPWLVGWGGASADAASADAPDAESGPLKPEEMVESLAPPGPSPSLRLLEYYEGEGSEKWLAFENPGAAGNAECELLVFANGANTPWRRVDLSGAWEQGEIRAYCTSAVALPWCDDLLSGSHYNGNDALVLTCQGEVADSLGRVGEDPGAGWVLSDLSTIDSHLVHCEGRDNDPSDAVFGPTKWKSHESGELLTPESRDLLCAVSPGEGGQRGF